MDQLIAYRSFVSYIDRSREYYGAQGYQKPYAWPRYDKVPFTPLAKPLAEARIGLVTTAGLPKPADPMKAMLYRRELYANRLAEYALQERIGSASPRFYGVPTDYSQARTIHLYGPQILHWCREDHVDAVVLFAL
jgi:hypothetical protein